MGDAARVAAGFSTLERGVSSGRAPSLIPPNQAANAVNATFRGDYVRTRPPYRNWAYTFADATVQANWRGIFQGEKWYDGEAGTSGWVIARGGRLFFLPWPSLALSEITPKVTTVVSADFTVPGVGGYVNVAVNTVYGLPLNLAVVIDGGFYSTNSPGSNPVPFQYFGAAAHATVTAGTTINDQAGAPIAEVKVLPDNYDFVYLFQAENYLIACRNQFNTVIFDGSSSREAGPEEIPPCVLGTYGWGRIWVALTDRRSFVAGDIVRGPSGTAANNGRDAVLKFTENTFLNEGGAFVVPFVAGPITAMNFLAAPDTSLGQGVLAVGTPRMVFSVNAPVDRTAWKALQYPIQTIALLKYGPKGPRNTVAVNGDLWHRSQDGFRSFTIARRAFGSPGNTPVSLEVDEILDKDAAELLFYGSGMNFDNRLLQTVSPLRTAGGVIHKGLVSVNFDLLSSLGEKQPPAWEGVWSGLDILQMDTAEIGEDERGFMFVLGANDLELWEVLTEGEQDEFYAVSGGLTTVTRKPIAAWLETRSEAYGNDDQLKGLHMGAFYIDEIFDTVDFTLKFRPDQYPTWITWQNFSLCAQVSQCLVPPDMTCKLLKNASKLYAARLTIPQPPENCNGVAGIPVREGREFQFRLEWTGSCRIRKFRTTASLRSQPNEGECPAAVQCQTLEDCGNSFFTYTSR